MDMSKTVCPLLPRSSNFAFYFGAWQAERLGEEGERTSEVLQKQARGPSSRALPLPRAPLPHLIPLLEWSPEAEVLGARGAFFKESEDTLLLSIHVMFCSAADSSFLLFTPDQQQAFTSLLRG